MRTPVRAPVQAAPSEGYQDGEVEEEIIDGPEGDEGDGDPAGQDAEGDDEEDVEGGEEDLDPDEPPARAQPTRGQARFQRLSNEVAELRRERDQLRGQRPPVQPVAGPAQPQEEPDAAFQARISLLAPHEQMMETQRRSEARMTRFIQMQTLQNQDALDKAQYDAKAASSPRYKRYTADVEKLRTELMAQGQMVPRQVLLEVVLGRRVLANDDLGRSSGKGKQRQAAQRRVAAQQVRPSQARSDVAAGRGRLTEAQAREKRLENMQI